MSPPHRACSSLYFSCVQYIPAKGERVVGVIAQTGAKQYRVDIGAHSLAALPELSFEGATKRNKPNLQVGSSASCSRCGSIGAGNGIM